MKSGNKPGFKKMGATEAIKQVDTTKAAKGRGSEREIYKAKLRGDYIDATGDKLEKMSYDDQTGTVVSRDPHYLDSPTKQKDYIKYNAAGNRIDMMGNEHTVKARANRNTIGSPKAKIKSKLPKNFNATGSSKAGEFAKVAKKSVKQVAKTAGKKILSKAILPVAIGLELVDMYRSGQKHSGGKAVKGQKSFLADAKKNQKSIMKQGKKTKSILNKKK